MKCLCLLMYVWRSCVKIGAIDCEHVSLMVLLCVLMKGSGMVGVGLGRE